jgi:hypothetical protein
MKAIASKGDTKAGQWLPSNLTAGLYMAAVGCFVFPLLGQVVVKNQGFLPFGDAPINYRSSLNLTDPIAKLQQQLDRGEQTLKYEPGHGYLNSVLHALRIPVSSQTLVFSKTSFQYPYITPASPRALYFNDDVYVGQVHHSKSLEFVSFDPTQGAIFYILDESKVEHPRFERSQLDCVQCHVSTSTTRGIPGVMVRSVYTSPSGHQAAGTPAYVTGHESPLEQRWGGWYVTGTYGKQTHLGNAIVANAKSAGQLDRAAGANITSLADRIDTSRYLTGHSDVVAHLVLAHQTQMHNLITETNYRFRLGAFADEARNKKEGLPAGTISSAARQQFERPAEALVKYLLFVNEAPLADTVKGTSGFTEQFAALGPRDSLGRSVRDFDLHKRIFKYPCSYLIYSEAFDAIPGPAKEYIYRRLFEVLSGRERSPEFESLSDEDRRAIFEILVATKPGLPEEWKQFVEHSAIQPRGRGTSLILGNNQDTNTIHAGAVPAHHQP